MLVLVYKNSYHYLRCLSTAAALPNQIVPKSDRPTIKCKRSQFDHISGKSPAIASDAKFGTIALASGQWQHHKAKGDFFTIQAHPKSCALDLGESFADSLVHPAIVDNLRQHFQISHATQLQSRAIPQLNGGQHTLIAAETGCGKTLAYLIPIVQQILKHKSSSPKHDFNTPLALVLTPGRELAQQIEEVARKLCAGLNINVHSIVGGKTKQKMLNPEFRDVDLMVGTVGATSKLVTTGIYRMKLVRHVVLDEADTLLDDSFNEKLVHFLKRFPFHRNNFDESFGTGTQLILASATMPSNAHDLMQSVIDVTTIQEVVSPNVHHILPNVAHRFLRMNKSDRPGHLLSLVRNEAKKRRPVIIFGNKSVTSDFISLFLNDRGVECVNLNGDMLEKIRVGQFEKFQSMKVDVLATTDVGSRGLDTTRARHVINFDFPLYAADYIHRCGRIGRIGSDNECSVVNFVSSLREINLVQRIEHAARTGQALSSVDGNITSIIKKNVMKQIRDDEARIKESFPL